MERSEKRKRKKRKTDFRADVHRMGMERLNDHRMAHQSRRSTEKKPPVKIERQPTSWVGAMIMAVIRGERKKNSKDRR